VSTWTLNVGSCIGWHAPLWPVTGLHALASSSVDSIVTDPPAGIGFMGKEWDGNKGGRDQWIAWLSSVMAECLRVLKPGGHALVWALPRTSHWTATAIEDAGFEIRDVHHHIFGTGFPKSLTSKSAEIPEGTGTALKPATEHWILCRKPLDGTVAGNYARHGTGVLNVDACRIGATADYGRSAANARGTINAHAGIAHEGKSFAIAERQGDYASSLGRWPAHLSLDEFAAGLLDEQSGVLTSGGAAGKTYTNGAESGEGWGNIGSGGTGRLIADSGGASRFFFVAKGSRAEKDAGLEGMTRSTGGEATGRKDGAAGTNNPRAGSGRTGGARNVHPTVKSIELMRWLVRLVTPPGGLVLDAFAGSGTTGVACIAEGARFVGFELSPEYAAIARSRLTAASRQLSLFAPQPAAVESPAEPEQPGLFDALGGVR